MQFYFNQRMASLSNDSEWEGLNLNPEKDKSFYFSSGRSKYIAQCNFSLLFWKYIAIIQQLEMVRLAVQSLVVIRLAKVIYTVISDYSALCLQVIHLELSAA